MENIFGIGALFAACAWVYLHMTTSKAADVAAQEAAELERGTQLALLHFRQRVWHFVIPSISPMDNNELCHAAECQAWLKAAQNPTGVKVFVCHYQDIDNHDETWTEYQTRLKAFRKQVRDERAQEFQNAQNTEGVDVSYYQQFVLGKRLPVAASFAPVLLIASPNSLLFLMVTVLFCVIGGRMMDNLSSPKKAKQQQKKAKNAPKTHQDAIHEANKNLARAGLKIEMNAGNVSLVAMEAQKK